MDNALDMLKRHEGLRLKPYRCSVGKLTIGYGRNLEDNGIRLEEAETLLYNDVQEVINTLKDELIFFESLSPNRKSVFINMCFNLGWPRFRRFKRMLAAAEIRDFESAADEMRESVWAGQVGLRADELIKIMREG